MKNLFFVFLLSLSGIFSSASATEFPNQVHGAPNKGSLQNPTALPADGVGLLHLFRARNRFWASQGLVEIIEHVAREIAIRYPEGERFQVGDLSAEKGGFISGHASHQNGIDFDGLYFRRSHEEQDPEDLGGFHEEFVVKGKVTKNFDIERNWLLVKLLKETGRLNRIFVDPAIKNALCKYALRTESDTKGATEEVLRHLRPYENHGDHLHVRITCPVESPNCVEQEPIAPGSGCL